MKKILSLLGYGFLLAMMGVFVTLGVVCMYIGIANIFDPTPGPILAIGAGFATALYFLLKLGEIAMDSNELRGKTRRGEWKIHNIDDNGMIVFKCSVCGCKRYGRSNYCHNCGAKMDGKEKDDA